MGMFSGRNMGTVGGGVAGGVATGGNPLGVMVGAGVGGMVGGMLDDAGEGREYNAPDYGGSPGYVEARSVQMDQRRAAVEGRQAPKTDYTQANADYAQQQNALGMMRSAAEGKEPSVAQLQMQQGQRDAAAAAQGMASTARGGGGNAMLAMRQAQGANAEGAARTNQQAAMLRAQEMAQAREAYGGMAGNMRGQSAQQAQFQTQAAMQQTGMNDQRAMGYEDLEHKMRAQQQNAGVAAMNATAQSQMAADQNKAGMMGGLMNGGMGIAAGMI